MAHIIYELLHSAVVARWTLPSDFINARQPRGQPGCFPSLPQPNLSFTGTEDYVAVGTTFRLYKLSVSNSSSFPDALFAPAPDLPACGLNTNSSRTWVDIYSSSGARIYGYCALTAASQLNNIAFALPITQPPPASVYIALADRRCMLTYTSNLVPIPWLSFAEGNAGPPADGVFATASAPNYVFHLNPPFPLAGTTDGFTTTVFPRASDVASFGATGYVEITVMAPYLPQCNGGVATIGINNGLYGAPPLQPVVVNGVQGKATSVPQSQVSLFPAMVIGNSAFGSGCSATLSDLYVTALRAFPNALGALPPLSTLDAAAIKLGQNAYPQ